MRDCKNKNFCVLPWIHFHAWANGMVLPCCMAWDTDNGDIINFGDLTKKPIEDIWNNSQYKELRNNMLEGKPSAICQTCYDQEALTFPSFRENNNKRFMTPALEETILRNTKDDGTYEDFNLLYWDIRYNNVCNYKCRMCSPHFSTKWYEDSEMLGWGKIPGPFILIEKFEEWLEDHKNNLTNLQMAYFAGGEPMVQDEHYQFLEFLIDKGITDVELYYQSNGSILRHKKRNIFDLWKHFKDVTYSVSLDGLGPMGEYIRSGMKTHVVDKNLQAIRDNGYRVTVSSVIQMYNIMFLGEFWDELASRDWCNSTQIYFQPLLRPEYLRTKHLPDDMKLIAIGKLMNCNGYKAHPEIFDPVILALREDRSEEAFAEFVSYTKVLDAKRNEKITDWWPEMGEYFG